MSDRQVSRQRRWQIRKHAEGRCIVCGSLRGKQGTACYCKLCNAKVLANKKIWRKYKRKPQTTDGTA